MNTCLWYSGEALLRSTVWCRYHVFHLHMTYEGDWAWKTCYLLTYHPEIIQSDLKKHVSKWCCVNLRKICEGKKNAGVFYDFRNANAFQLCMLPAGIFMPIHFLVTLPCSTGNAGYWCCWELPFVLNVFSWLAHVVWKKWAHSIGLCITNKLFWPGSSSKGGNWTLKESLMEVSAAVCWLGRT